MKVLWLRLRTRFLAAIIVLVLSMSDIFTSAIGRSSPVKTLQTKDGETKQSGLALYRGKGYLGHVSILGQASKTGSGSTPAGAASVPSAPSSSNTVKLLMFLFYGSLGCVMPYIPMYYRHIGISPNYIGLFGAITPAVNFIMSPLWGVLADTTKMHKEIMLFTFITSVFVRVSMTWNPHNIRLLCSLVALAATLNAPVKPLIDSAVLSLLKDKKDYGKSRLFGQVGFGVGAWIGGLFLEKDLKYMFFVHAAVSVLTAALMMKFTPKPEPIMTEKRSFSFFAREKQKVDIISGLKVLVDDPKILIFFSIVLFIGISSGVIENFAYVRAAELGASGRCIGVCRLVSSLAGAPMFWLSGQVTKAIGVNGVLTLSLVSYLLRFLIYASIQNPWHALPAEVLRGVTFATFWAGSTYHVYNVSPVGLTATMLGILNALYAGLGQSLGSLIGKITF